MLASTLSSLSYALLPGSGSPCGARSSSRCTRLASGLQRGSVGCRLRGHVIRTLSSRRRPRRCLLLRATYVQNVPSTSQKNSCLAGVCRASVPLVPLILGYRTHSGAVG
ncbi:hypothetical protein DL98DRAFT_277254 [Cadophora sp. DSE1049]|nr:hypothetical protein DL98DRAFT_277254 [Cadophora sp. DSE1049]